MLPLLQTPRMFFLFAKKRDTIAMNTVDGQSSHCSSWHPNLVNTGRQTCEVDCSHSQNQKIPGRPPPEKHQTKSCLPPYGFPSKRVPLDGHLKPKQNKTITQRHGPSARAADSRGTEASILARPPGKQAPCVSVFKRQKDTP